MELRHADQSLLIDLGAPLMEPDGTPFDQSRLLGKRPETLCAEGILPDVPGLYPHNQEAGTVLAVLLSHAHQDHYGFLRYIHPGIPVFAGAPTHTLLRVSREFMGSVPHIADPHAFETSIPFEVGPFRVTPYLMDHSAFDAHAFLVEVVGRRIFYSGDFREGGWKTNPLETLARLCPTPVDALLMEGTTLGSSSHEGCATEAEVAQTMTEVFCAHAGKPALVYASGQNIDRISAVVKAANASGRTPVLDLYQASVLLALARHNPRLPYPMSRGKEGMRVWFTERTWKNWRHRHPGAQVAQPLIDARIYPNEVPEILPRAVLMVRPSMLQDLEKLPALREGNLIYSLWEGYKENEDTKKLLDFLKGRGFAERVIHTSGHAGEETLHKLVRILQPRILLPIHTLHPEWYGELFGVPVHTSGTLVLSNSRGGPSPRRELEGGCS